jgi:flagellar M-ring protein FliF
VVSVDAVFSHEQSRVTTEEVLPARGQEGDGPATGVVLRERQTTREAAADGGRSSAPAVVNSETDYQTGRRTEQVVTPAGVLRQLNVAVVVKRSLDEAELQRVSDLVAASVGAVRSRGDVVTVHSMQQLQVPAGDNRAPMPERSTAPGVPSKPDGPRAHVGGAPTVMLWGAAAICALLAAAVFVARRRREQPVPVQSVPLLTELDRVRMLQTIRQWAAQDATQAGS